MSPDINFTIESSEGDAGVDVSASESETRVVHDGEVLRRFGTDEDGRNRAIEYARGVVTGLGREP